MTDHKDNLGPIQSRVLPVDDRSFESVTYQYKKPPLSCELDLGSRIDMERCRQNLQSKTPSGWLGGGKIVDGASTTVLQTGDVLCSSDLVANTFKLIANNPAGKNIAIVNGWEVVVQGCNSTDENNIIICSSPGASRVDFVFLEVWRKLIAAPSTGTPSGDPVYKCGSYTYAGTNPGNDLIDPAINLATSLRIQLQYRIRSVAMPAIDPANYREGFNQISPVAQGPNGSEIRCTDCFFKQSSTDPGLWIAGAGDSASQETFGTVDGYIYAIPMFLVVRRGIDRFIVDEEKMGMALRTLADYRSGIASDRPDGLYNNWIVAGDILDIRHEILGNTSLKDLCAKALNKLTRNDLAGKISFDEGYYGIKRVTCDETNPTGSAPYNLKYVPTKFLAAYEGAGIDATHMIAMPENDLRAKTSLPVSGSNYPDHTGYTHFSNRRALTTNLWDFGHLLVYDTTGNGTADIIVPRIFNDSAGGLYPTLGIPNCTINNDIVFSPTKIIRNSTSYTITFSSPVSLDDFVEVYLYTQGKFFDGNRQTKSITHCYEMLEITANETGTGSKTDFSINGTKTILALGGYGPYIDALQKTCFAYAGDEQKPLVTTNNSFPDGTSCIINFLTPPNPGTQITVPVLVNSAIDAGEKFSFVYETMPYQGLLNSSTTGVVETEGPAIITSAGSGTATNFTYSTGLASFTAGSNYIAGSDTSWLGNAKHGYLISASGFDSTKYEIHNPEDDTMLRLEEPARTDSGDFVGYTISAQDQPFYTQSNIIDLMPTFEADNDVLGISNVFSTTGDPAPVLETRIISRVQDILDLPANTALIGINTADRGRSTIQLPADSAPLGLGNLGLKFETVSGAGYKKLFQTYILNKDNSGRLYLMVVGSETDNSSTSTYLNHASNSDSVDIFELPGRPLLINRTQ